VVRAVMLKGANLSEVGFQLSMLALFVAAYAFLALTRFRRTSTDTHMRAPCDIADLATRPYAR
jgi:hypothetical protein